MGTKLRDNLESLVSNEDKKATSLEDKFESGMLKAIDLEYDNLVSNSEKHNWWILCSIKRSARYLLNWSVLSTFDKSDFNEIHFSGLMDSNSLIIGNVNLPLFKSVPKVLPNEDSDPNA